MLNGIEFPIVMNLVLVLEENQERKLILKIIVFKFLVHLNPNILWQWCYKSKVAFV